jgi:hypothetical protein
MIMGDSYLLTNQLRGFWWKIYKIRAYLIKSNVGLEWCMKIRGVGGKTFHSFHFMILVWSFGGMQ